MARPTDKRWKGIIIDWPTIADMDSEDYELKPLNQQQVAILLALLEYQKWPTRWTGLEMSKSELETYIADIEQRLMRNEGGGMATKDDIRDGIYEAFNRLALQLASGGYTNISVDEEGNVTSGDDATGGTDEIPEDDPATSWDESAAAVMGAAINVSKAIEVLYDKIDNFYGATNGTPVTSALTTTLYLSLYFPVDEATFGDAVTAYYTYRNTNNRLLWDTSETQQNVLYCQGADLSGWNKWLIDYSGFAESKISVMSGLTNALAPEFWAKYYNEGLPKPSTQYLDAPCVPIVDQTLDNMVFGVARNTTILKANHRMLMIVDGYATDVDGDIQDWFWFRTAAGVNTFQTATFVHSAGSNLPSQTEVPYNTVHHYEYTVDLANLTQFMTITLNKHASLNAAGLVTNVPFKIVLKDLGQHTII